MLDERVLQAVRAGQFHVYAVREGGRGAGAAGGHRSVPRTRGRFPKGSVNDLVVARRRYPNSAWKRTTRKRTSRRRKRPSRRRTRPRRRRTESGALPEPAEGGAGKPRPRAFQPCGQVPAGAMRNLAAGVAQNWEPREDAAMPRNLPHPPFAGLTTRIECVVRPLAEKNGLWTLLAPPACPAPQPSAIRAQGPSTTAGGRRGVAGDCRLLLAQRLYRSRRPADLAPAPGGELRRLNGERRPHVGDYLFRPES